MYDGTKYSNIFLFKILYNRYRELEKILFLQDWNHFFLNLLIKSFILSLEKDCLNSENSHRGMQFAWSANFSTFLFWSQLNFY